MSTSNPPKALLTDVFGTVVDWRTTVTSHLTDSALESLNSSSKSISSTVRARASTMNWGHFAQQWRNSYYEYTRNYDPETQPFKSIDQHHLESLLILLASYDLGPNTLWTEAEIQKISLIWHFLDPWADSPGGLLRLREGGFRIATLSNGNTALLSDLASHGDLPYTHIISAADFKAYKPHPSVYRGGAAKLGLETTQCALVAAHLGDLHAAKACGYQTIYIERPQEEGWTVDKVEQAKKEGWVDMWVDKGQGGFMEVARRFGLE